MADPWADAAAEYKQQQTPPGSDMWADAAKEYHSQNAGPGATSRFVGNFASQLNPFPAIGRYVFEQPSGERSDVKEKVEKGDYKGAVTSAVKSAALSALGPAARMVPDALSAQSRQFVRAYEDLNDKKGQPSAAARISSAAGHAAAGMLPLVGPAAANAGEQIGAGDVAGGLGSASGIIAGMKTPALMRGAKKVLSPVGDSTAGFLQRSAEKNIETALHPSTKPNKVLVQRQLAPGLVQRGVVARSLKSLVSRAEGEKANWGDKIDDYIQANGHAPLPGGGSDIVQRIDQEISTKTKGNVTPTVNRPYIGALNEIRQNVIQMAKDNGGQLTLENIRWLRQQYDRTASAKNAFTLPPKEANRIAGVTDGMNIVRDTISQHFPDLAKLNKEYNFWANTHKVAADSVTRKVGQVGPMTRRVASASGAVLGGVVGGPKGAILGAEAANEASKFGRSALWNTTAAQLKGKTANLLRGGRPPVPPSPGPVRPPLQNQPPAVPAQTGPAAPPAATTATPPPAAAPNPQQTLTFAGPNRNPAPPPVVTPPPPAASTAAPGSPPAPRTSVTLRVPGVGDMSFPIGTSQEEVQQAVRAAQAKAAAPPDAPTPPVPEAPSEQAAKPPVSAPQSAPEPPPIQAQEQAAKPAEQATPVEAPPEQNGTLQDGAVTELHRSKIKVDPDRFQFKGRAIGKGGTTDELRDIEEFDRDKAGVLSVWKDPKDGETYVVNGHHRLERANALKYDKPLLVQYLKAKTAAKARTEGALINIGEGRGDPIDAAKVLRDNKLNPDKLKKQLGNGTLVKQGLALSKLSDPVFKDVATGKLPEGRGVAIGQTLENEADQEAAAKLSKDADKKGRNLSDSEFKETIRLIKSAPRISESQDSLFGSETVENNLGIEKGQISSYVKGQMATDKRLFKSVSRQSAADRLSGAGNVLKTEDNAARATDAAQAIEIYERLSGNSGPINDILDESARELAEGKPPGDVKSRAYERISEQLRRELSALQRGGTGRTATPPGPTVGDGSDTAAAGLRKRKPRVSPQTPPE